MWRIDLLGRLCIRRGQHEISRFRTHRTAALLAYLGCFPNRVHLREDLMELFWPDSPLEARRNGLRVALTALRQQLEGNDVHAGEVLVTDRASVRLCTSRYTTDVSIFEDLLKRAGGTEEASRHRSALLEAAIEYYGGPLLPGFDDGWVHAERCRIEDAYLGALRGLVRCHIQQSDIDGALTYARQALQVDPLREESHRTLMRLYAKQGRTATALEQYDELKRLYREAQLGEPAPPTRELAAQLCARLGDSVSPGATGSHPPAAAAVTEAAGSPSAADRVSFRPDVRREEKPTQLIGREIEIDELRSLLCTPSVRLVTIVGAGGAGKTSLARELLHSPPAHFCGAWISELADLSEPGLLPTAALQTVVRGKPPSGSPMEALIAALAGRPTLLCLDNFEQLLCNCDGLAGEAEDDFGPPIGRAEAPDSDGRAFVAALLHRLPQLTCLVTSRQPLDLAGEHVYTVLPLPVPAQKDSLSSLRECASVALFEARATAANKGFRLTKQNAGSVAELCIRLDGLPLALELAAAWAATLTPAQMLARLTDSLRLLVSERRDVDRKHRSIRAAMEWSFQLLTPAQQRCLDRLSVFRGGATVEAAEAILEDPDTLVHLRQLQARSLVLRSEGPDEGGAIRLRLLETIRQYAEERCDRADRHDLIRRHAVYFTQLAEELNSLIQGPGQAECLDRFDSDHDNFRAAFRRSLDAGEPELALRLAAALHPFWRLRGHLIEGRQRIREVLCHPGASSPTLARARALAAAWILAWHHGDLEEAGNYLDEGVALARVSEHRAGLAALLNNRGNLALCQADISLARACYTESLEIRRAIGDQVNQAGPLNNLGEIARRQKEFAAAECYFQEALQVWRKCESDEGVAGVLHNLGCLSLDCLDLHRASALFRESLEIRSRLKDEAGIAQTLESLAAVHLQRGETERALQLCAAAAGIRETTGEPPAAEGMDREQLLLRLRTVVQPERFERLWAQGRAEPAPVIASVLAGGVEME